MVVGLWQSLVKTEDHNDNQYFETDSKNILLNDINNYIVYFITKATENERNDVIKH